MLAARVKQEAGPGLDHTAQVQTLQERANGIGSSWKVRRQGIERVIVQREGDAAIAELGENREGVFQAVVGEAVGVVADTHGGGSIIRRNLSAARGLSRRGQTPRLPPAWPW